MEFKPQAAKTKNTWIAAGSLATKKAKGIGNVVSYALHCLFCLNLNGEAPENLEKSNKAVSQTFFNT